METLSQEDLEEAARLSALHELEILDTAAEEAYDELVQLAARIAGTPIALVSLVDRHRQWFKARYGLEAEETPREHAFCAHAIQKPDEPFVVEDATADPRFVDNPLVTGNPNIRFYAGFPIRLPHTKLALGTLCVISDQRMSLDVETTERLKILSRQVERLFELRRFIAGLSSKEEELQQQFKVHFHQARLARIGELAAGVGHEINNPLAIIRSSLDFIRSQLHQENPNLDLLSQLIDKQQDAALRIQKITQGLQDFSRDEQSDPQVITLQSVVEDTIHFVQEMYAKVGIHVEAVYGEDPLPVLGFPQRIQQVLLNLLGNAKDALLQSSNSPKRITLALSRQGESACIDVVDNGIGIPEDLQEKVFQNFFTTKTSSKGTGMGLAIALSICQSMKGGLSCCSKDGETVFRMVLPYQR